MAASQNQYNMQGLRPMKVQLPPLIMELPMQLVPTHLPSTPSLFPRPSLQPSSLFRPSLFFQPPSLRPPAEPQPPAQLQPPAQPRPPTPIPTPLQSTISLEEKSPVRHILCLRCGRTRVIINVNDKTKIETNHSCPGHTQASKNSKVGNKKIKVEK
ncbi:unnamed protein product [Adineta steineri]|uniref:Uncharacterized protein n=1 Tax=Adineta steineri TaxID=433720 RepID=A0A815FC84_9BILA|nr:unnamed protein product [Adineta steineri]CAF3785158.1 unnamed protein product [Adineta steineri]